LKQKTTIIVLVGILLLSACRGHQSTSNQNTVEIHPELKNVPVYPEALGWAASIPGADMPQGYEIYSYPAETLRSKILVDFYKDNMPSNGWELFEEMENEIENRKSTTLLFSKQGTVAQLSIT